MRIHARATVIGGPAPADRNLISGNSRRSLGTRSRRRGHRRSRATSSAPMRPERFPSGCRTRHRVLIGTAPDASSAAPPPGQATSSRATVCAASSDRPDTVRQSRATHRHGRRRDRPRSATAATGSDHGHQRRRQHRSAASAPARATSSPSTRLRVLVTDNGGSNNSDPRQLHLRQRGLRHRPGRRWPPNFNDPRDADDGAESPPELPDHPVRDDPRAAGHGTHIQGKLNSTPSTTFDLDFYANPACSNFPREFLEGETYLGSSQVTTDGSGNAAIDVTLPVDDPRPAQQHLRDGDRSRRQHLRVLAADRLLDQPDLGARRRAARPSPSPAPTSPTRRP